MTTPNPQGPGGLTSAEMDALLGPTRGMVARRAAGGWSGLAVGASGKVLSSDGTDVVWGDAAPAGQTPIATSGIAYFLGMNTTYSSTSFVTITTVSLSSGNTGVRNARVYFHICFDTTYVEHNVRFQVEGRSGAAAYALIVEAEVTCQIAVKKMLTLVAEVTVNAAENPQFRLKVKDLTGDGVTVYDMHTTYQFGEA